VLGGVCGAVRRSASGVAAILASGVAASLVARERFTALAYVLRPRVHACVGLDMRACVCVCACVCVRGSRLCGRAGRGERCACAQD